MARTCRPRGTRSDGTRYVMVGVACDERSVSMVRLPSEPTVRRASSSPSVLSYSSPRSVATSSVGCVPEGVDVVGGGALGLAVGGCGVGRGVGRAEADGTAVDGLGDAAATAEADGATEGVGLNVAMLLGL